MSEAKLYTLFPEILYIKMLDDIDDKTISTLIKNLKKLEYMKAGWEKQDEYPEQVSSSSIDRYIFKSKEFKSLGNRILKEFAEFKNKKLFYTKNDFVFTTSWATRSKPGQSSEYHNHSNAMWSGVFYANTEQNAGDIIFNKFNQRGIHIESSEYDLINSEVFNLYTKNKMLIFFPSHMFHRIAKNNSKITRYSIACNLMPTGTLFRGDSELKWNL